ncbi:MAG: hypothetical protein WEB52_01905 [Dehalococcoidia bacterium]
MTLDDRPQLPLTARKKALVAAGVALFAVQVAGALAIAPYITGPGDANFGALVSLWGVATLSSVVVALLLVRQADLPDVATASMLVTIATFAAFTLSAAYDVRGSDDEVNMVDALFLGVTSGALTAMVVWGIAMLAARVLRLPTTAALHDRK